MSAPPPPYRCEIDVAAPLDAVREAARALFGSDTAFLLHTELREDMAVTVEYHGSDGRTRVVFSGERSERLPYFHWFLAYNLNRLSRRAVTYEARRLAAFAEGRDEPERPKRSVFAPPVAFNHHEASTLATICAITFVAGVGSSLFSGNSNVVADAYAVSDRALSFGSAATRAGVLVGLVAAAVADRIGRRKVLLFSAAGVCVASGLSAVAPTFETFVASQLLARGLFNAVLVVATIVAIEEAPERGRSYAVAMVTLAWGGGGALATVLLPIGDLGTEAWRVSFAVSAALIVFVPSFARNLTETARFTDVVERFLPRGRLGELFGGVYRSRAVLILGASLLTNIMAAASSGLANRFLGDERGFSQTEIALFLAVVAGIPGLVGLFIGGRLAETIGRKPVSIVGLILGTVSTMAFFLVDGPALWILGTIDSFVAAVAATALRSLGPELFPTEVRGTANAAFLVLGLIGSAIGLISTGILSESWSLGASIAVLGVFPIIAAVALIPFLPEPAGKELDAISPPAV